MSIRVSELLRFTTRSTLSKACSLLGISRQCDNQGKGRDRIRRAELVPVKEAIVAYFGDCDQLFRFIPLSRSCRFSLFLFLLEVIGLRQFSH